MIILRIEKGLYLQHYFISETTIYYVFTMDKRSALRLSDGKEISYLVGVLSAMYYPKQIHREEV